MVDVIHDCAKFKFECGTYADAAEYLYFYRLLVSWSLIECCCLGVLNVLSWPLLYCGVVCLTPYQFFVIV